jgi:ferritin
MVMDLSKTMQEALNQHLNHELESSYLYLSMAAYLSTENFPGAAHWMRLQAQEELVHAMKFYNYINDRSGRIILLALDAPPIAWRSLLDVFESGLEHEKKMSQKINALVDLSLQEKDHATNTMLQWLVTEQVEEESTFTELINKFKLAGSDGSGMFMIDEGLATRTSVPDAI